MGERGQKKREFGKMKKDVERLGGKRGKEWSEEEGDREAERG